MSARQQSEIDALMGQADQSAKRGKFQDAIGSLKKVLQQSPDHVEALLHLGMIFGETGDVDRAIDTFLQASVLMPEDTDILYNLGYACQKKKQYPQALQHFERAIALDPHFFEAISAAGDVLRHMEEFEKAIIYYDRALKIEPRFYLACNNKSLALMALGRAKEALASCDRAIQIKPDYAIGWLNRGHAVVALRRNKDALNSFNNALRFNPNMASAYVARGNFHFLAGDLEAGRLDLKKALALDPNLAEAHAGLGSVLSELKQHDEALAAFQRAFDLDPSSAAILGQLISARFKACDWRDAKSMKDALFTGMLEGTHHIEPFVLLSLTDDERLHLIAARKAASKLNLPPNPAQSFTTPVGPKIRIGYFSGDFHTHAVAFLIAGLFEQHDKTQFETIAFSFGLADNDDAMRQRLKLAFDCFIDAKGMSNKDILTEARRLNLDIAVDLSGYTNGARTEIFAQRIAPVQVNYLGYPGTIGSEAYDYIVADKVVIPEAQRAHYTEKVVYLPNQYQANDRNREISDRVFMRSEIGLPDDGFVFCCFNNNYKITPEVFEIWISILRAVPNSVLWLLEDSATAKRNLRSEIVKAGLNPDRLVFAGRMPLSDHLARHRAADLFLDTRPYNAHTTASDALWAGLPVLTRMGESFASRVAGSLLLAAELPELVTRSDDAYRALAIELATKPAKLKALRDRLAANRLNVPLFDTALITRHIEAAFKIMHERRVSELPPDHFSV